MSALKADEEFESDKPETEVRPDTADVLRDTASPARSTQTQIRHAEFLEALQRAVEATRNVTNGFSPPEADHEGSALVPEDVRDEAPPIHDQAASSYDRAAPANERAVHPHEPSEYEHPAPSHEPIAPAPERPAPYFERAAFDHGSPPASPPPERVPPMLRWADRNPGGAALAGAHHTPATDVPKPLRARPPRPLAERSPLDRPAWERPQTRQQPSEVEAQRRRDEAVRRLKEYQRSPLPSLGAGYQPGRGRGWLGMAGRFGLVGAVVGAAAFFVVQLVGANSRAPAGPSFWSGLVGGEPASSATAPRLILSELSGVTNRPAALAVNVEAAPSGGSILVQGLPPGSRITAGASAGAGAWRVPVRELAHAAIVPPMNFAGMMTFTVDLRRADDSVADSDVLRMNWTPNAAETVVPKPVRTTTIGSGSSSYSPGPQAAASEPATSDELPAAELRSNRAVAAAILRHLDREEVANLLKRGQIALQNGDLSAARLLLNRAAEAGDAQAAMALGATYDPRVLRELRALGASADVEKARSWYQKAAEMGASEANQRLQQLAQQSQ